MNRDFLAQQINALFRLVGQNLNISDSEKMQIADLYPAWKVEQDYSVDTIVKHGLNSDGETQLWKVVQAHTSQASWTPDKAPSLFSKIGFKEDGTQIWTQPLGSHDAYMKGDIVSHKGEIWVSDIDNNIWEPGVYGWTKKSK